MGVMHSIQDNQAKLTAKGKHGLGAQPALVWLHIALHVVLFLTVTDIHLNAVLDSLTLTARRS